jgi:hypothetical protein
MTQFCRYIFHTWSIWDISSESKATRSKMVNSPLDSMQLETRRVMAWWRDGFVTEALLFTVVVTPPDPHWPGHFFWLIEPRSIGLGPFSGLPCARRVNRPLRWIDNYRDTRHARPSGATAAVARCHGEALGRCHGFQWCGGFHRFMNYSFNMF